MSHQTAGLPFAVSRIPDIALLDKSPVDLRATLSERHIPLLFHDLTQLPNVESTGSSGRCNRINSTFASNFQITCMIWVSRVVRPSSRFRAVSLIV